MEPWFYTTEEQFAIVYFDFCFRQMNDLVMMINADDVNQYFIAKSHVRNTSYLHELYLYSFQSNFRQDGFEWEKRKDGKSTREDHLKIKFDGIEVGFVVKITPCSSFNIFLFYS